MSRFTDWLDRRGSGRMITRRGSPYLKRYYVFYSKKLNILIHQFWASDPDDLHDHPWNWFSFILKGSYTEHRADGTSETRLARSWKFRKAEEFHRIEVTPGSEGTVWTLFIHGKRQRKWGFLKKNLSWLKADEYDKEEVDIIGRDFNIKGHFFPRIEWINEKE